MKPRFTGPYELISVLDGNKSASIRLKTGKVRIYNLDLLKPYVSGHQSEPEEEDDQDERTNPHNLNDIP